MHSSHRTRDYAQANLALRALEFGSSMFALGCTRNTASVILQLANAQYVRFQGM